MDMADTIKDPGGVTFAKVTPSGQRQICRVGREHGTSAAGAVIMKAAREECLRCQLSGRRCFRYPRLPSPTRDHRGLGGHLSGMRLMTRISAEGLDPRQFRVERSISFDNPPPNR